MLLPVLSHLAARAPESWMAAVAHGGGAVLHALLPRRRALARRNLALAYPDRDASWHREVTREAFRLAVETALLALALPSMPPDRLRERFQATGRELLPAPGSGRGLIAAIPHLGPWESLALLPLVLDRADLPAGTLYRAHGWKPIEAWTRRSRSRFGLHLFARQDGLRAAARFVRAGGCLGVLFDQNAGLNGCLVLQLGRIASASDLAENLARLGRCECLGIWAERTGFWRGVLHLERLPPAPTITEAQTQWLDRLLVEHPVAARTWLWLHDRWRTQDIWHWRFRLRARRSLLPGLTWEATEPVSPPPDRLLAGPILPRRRLCLVRLPNWLGDVVMALPLLRALRQARPDLAFHWIARAAHLPWLERLGLADGLTGLPAGGWEALSACARLRRQFPEVALILTHSWRGDLQILLSGAPQRLGQVLAGRWRPLLTHRWSPPAGIDPAGRHQLEAWMDLARAFGLELEADRTPFRAPAAPASSGPLWGFVAGTENFPAKRWPVASWQELGQRLLAEDPRARLVLFGTARDRAITEAVAAALPGDRVDNRAGRTSLLELADGLAQCTTVVSNDTGAMHLANAVGVPVVALFGPTNPVRTAPVFSGTVLILQPPGCPPTGGGRMTDLRPERVFQLLPRASPPTPAPFPSGPAA